MLANYANYYPKKSKPAFFTVNPFLSLAWFSSFGQQTFWHFLRPVGSMGGANFFKGLMQSPSMARGKGVEGMSK
jgi:hypothetical protein